VSVITCPSAASTRLPDENPSIGLRSIRGSVSVSPVNTIFLDQICWIVLVPQPLEGANAFFSDARADVWSNVGEMFISIASPAPIVFCENRSAARVLFDVDGDPLLMRYECSPSVYYWP
jgi:hypothetical protein